MTTAATTEPSALAKPADIDRMPGEVATSMLANPKRKMSNTFRKAAHRARQRVFNSSGPMRVTEDGKLLEPSTTAKKPIETKLLNRMFKATDMQLCKWQRRCLQRRRGLQEKYLATREKAGPKWDRIRELLEAAVRHLDNVYEAIAEVQHVRSEQRKFNDGPENHVHPRRCRTGKPVKNLCLAA